LAIRENALIDMLFQFFYIIAYRLLLCIWFFTRPTVYGVLVGVWHEDKVLIVSNSYRKRFSIPGGYQKTAEETRSAAVRELQEEVNLQILPSNLTYAGKLNVRYHFKYENVTFFETHLPVRPSIQTDNREVVWAEFMPLSEALELRLVPVVRAYLEGKQSTSRTHHGQ
jgi:8-oxo-dGTP pyrophosphatase MutT (NUDIX family)